MMIEKYRKILIEKSSLEDNFPPGIFDDYSNNTNDSTLFILTIIEDLIKENAKWNLYILRNWLLQSYSYRSFNDENQFYDINNNIINDDFIYQLLITITPSHFHSLISTLSNAESEIILKNYFSAHQTWGKPIGVVELVKSIFENALQKAIKINLNSFLETKKSISENIISRLKTKNSSLGQNFILGNEFQTSSEVIEVLVGPISSSDLSVLQNFGYADDIYPSNKILNIVRLCEPYYLNTKVKYIISTDGFVLKKSILGSDRLGLSFS